MFIIYMFLPTILIQREFVERKPTRLLPHIPVNAIRPVFVHSDGVFQRLHARLQAKRHLCVSDRMPSDISEHL